MPKPKSPDEILQLGEERRSGKQNNIVNGKPTFKELQPKVEANYAKMMALWHAFVKKSEGEGKTASVHDLESLQDWVLKWAAAIDGQEGIDAACSETVRKRWNDFTAAWMRANPEDPVQRGIARSVTEYINGPLAKELGMPKFKRARRFATKNLLLQYARQLLAADWFEYQIPGTMLDDWGLLLGNTYSSSRIGEYIESSCRAGTGRGLYFRDLMFAVFTNENGNPEFAIQLTRDAKNMSRIPHKRPQHALYEGFEPGLLCFNPLLPLLARLLARGAFRDYDDIDSLLRVVSSSDEAVELQWKEELLSTPLYMRQSADEIETAGAFSRRLRNLGIRAGCPIPARGHDFRAEGLYLMSLFTSKDASMVYAGHTDPGTLPKHYIPRNAADGQAAYNGQKGRAHVLDIFRGLTVPRNPNLWPCLPAKMAYEFENEPEVVKLNEETAALGGATDSNSQDRRKKLYQNRRQLLDQKLRSWQKEQPIKHGEPPGYHRAIFDRVRFMMPERDRLAENLFKVDVLRSSTGLSVLRDMITLYQKSSNVEYRPGLERDKCRCGKQTDVSSVYDWKHIYTCHKRACDEKYGFSELCFRSNCNKWFYGVESWEDHCRHHLHHLDDFPVWCDPLMYGGVLAAAGSCPFCRRKERLPARVRNHQFRFRSRWLEHMQAHIMELDEDKPTCCPDQRPHCPGSFDSPLELQFHLQDAHGYEYIKDSGKQKRSRDESDDILSRSIKRPRHNHHDEENEVTIADTADTTYTFKHVTINDFEIASHRPSRSRLSRKTPSPGLATENTDAGTESLTAHDAPMLGGIGCVHPSELDIEPRLEEYSETPRPASSGSASFCSSEGGSIWDQHDGTSGSSTPRSSLPSDPSLAAESDEEGIHSALLGPSGRAPAKFFSVAWKTDVVSSTERSCDGKEGDIYEPENDEGLDEFSSLWPISGPNLCQVASDALVLASPPLEVAIQAQTPTLMGQPATPEPSTDQGINLALTSTEMATNSNPPSTQDQSPQCIFCQKRHSRNQDMWNCMDNHLLSRSGTKVTCPCEDVFANEGDFKAHAYGVHHIPRRAVFLRTSGLQGASNLTKEKSASEPRRGKDATNSKRGMSASNPRRGKSATDPKKEKSASNPANSRTPPALNLGSRTPHKIKLVLRARGQ